MNKRNVRKFCSILLIFSMCIRVTSATGLDRRLMRALRQTRESEEFISWMFRLETGMDVEPQPAPEPLPRVWTVHITQPQAAAIPVPEKPKAPVFTAADAELVRLAGACSYDVDKQLLLLQDSLPKKEADGPQVLIVHTHSSEAYTPEVGWEYDESDPMRTGDENYSVIRVGTQLAQVLEENGIGVVHDTELNDYPTYDGAYERMRVKIEGYLAQHPSIRMVLDIHRDAVDDADGTPMAFSAGDTAQLMLVVGTDEGGLSHPNWAQNLSNAMKLQVLLEREHEGICRPIDLRTERFNAHLSAGSLLIEVGACGNTLREALRAADCLGRTLADWLSAME